MNEYLDNNGSAVNVTVNRTAHVFCNLTEFQHSFREVHGYISMLVCILGSIANVLNIVVLTRKEMKSATNIILTGLAVADLLVMVEYIPFAYSCLHKNHFFSFSWAYYYMVHAGFSQVCHTVAIWLTVTLAVWRYIAVVHPQTNRFWFKAKSAVFVIFSAYLICPLICIPLYFTMEIAPVNQTKYVVRLSNDKLFQLSNLIYSGFIKLIPCVLLTVLSLRIIWALLKTKKRRELLINRNHLLKSDNSNRPSIKKSKKMLDKEKQTDRTTKMLLVVLLSFLITEFPQGILGLLNYTLGQTFLIECYVPLGDVMDLLVLFNSAINFMIYCTMSRQFRVTFSFLFKPKILNKWMPVNQTNISEKDTTQVTQV